MGKHDEALLGVWGYGQAECNSGWCSGQLRCWRLTYSTNWSATFLAASNDIQMKKLQWTVSPETPATLTCSLVAFL